MAFACVTGMSISALDARRMNDNRDWVLTCLTKLRSEPNSLLRNGLTKRAVMSLKGSSKASRGLSSPCLWTQARKY